jgi:hypothetical protein
MIRSLLAMGFVLAAAYVALMVPLGKKTLVQHIRAIGQTREAQELIDGTAERVKPTLREAKERLVGEIVKSPAEKAIDEASASGQRASAKVVEAGSVLRGKN